MKRAGKKPYKKARQRKQRAILVVVAFILCVGLGVFVINNSGEEDLAEDDLVEETVLVEETGDTNEQVEDEEELQTVDLFIFMGQSNMSGKGDASEAPTVTCGYEFRAISDPTKLYPIEEPFGINENNPDGVDDSAEVNTKTGGLVAAFANTYYTMTGVPIVGVSCSECGTRIAEWEVGSSFYNDAISRLTAAKEFLNASDEYELRHTYVVWCQGEGDADNNMTSDEYYLRLQDIANGFIDGGYAEKFLVIEIGDRLDDLTKFDLIKDAQIRLCQDSEDVVLISTKFDSMAEAGLMKDNYHYTQEAYNQVGEEAGYYAAIYAVTGLEMLLR